MVAVLQQVLAQVIAVLPGTFLRIGRGVWYIVGIEDLAFEDVCPSDRYLARLQR